MGVDTPEKAAPWFVGDQEPWAGRATAHVQRAVASARTLTVVTAGTRDRHRRLLAHVFVDGRSLSLSLAEAGLAYETVSVYGDGGFTELAVSILQKRRPPDFELPAQWRRTHRRQTR